MIVEDVTIVREIIDKMIIDFQNLGIINFGDWLKRYESTISDVEEFVNTYCTKVKENRLDEIEQWEKVVMLNAVALYMIELDTNEIPEGMFDKILSIYVETIWNYHRMVRGEVKLIGTIFISDISLYEFVKT